MTPPQKSPRKATPQQPSQKPLITVDVDPVTVVAIIAALLLIPLLITGFWAQ